MKLLLSESRLLDTPLGELSIRYELLREEREPKYYSVRLWNETTGERSQAPELTTDRDLALRFFEGVLRGSVTPLTLREIVEDFLAEL